MNTFQKILAFSALIFSLSFAFYFFIYIPQSKVVREKKEKHDTYLKALDYCEKKRDGALEMSSDIPDDFIGEDTSQFANAGELKDYISGDFVSDCIKSALERYNLHY